MANPDQIEQEFREYLAIEKNLLPGDRLKMLMLIANKHFGMDNIEHTVNYRDFSDMMSYAKTNWANTSMPMTMSNKEVSSQEVSYVLMMEAFVGYLNKSKLLKRLVKFDITTRKK